MLAGRQRDRRLQRAAGVQAGANPPGESLPSLQRRRVIGGAVTPQELCAVAGPRRLLAAEVHEGHPSGEVRAPRVAREDRAGRRVELGHDERRAGTA